MLPNYIFLQDKFILFGINSINMNVLFVNNLIWKFLLRVINLSVLELKLKEGEDVKIKNTFYLLNKRPLG